MILNPKPNLRVATGKEFNFKNSVGSIKMDSYKELANSENSKNSKQSKNISEESLGSNEEDSKKKKYASQKDLNLTIPGIEKNPINTSMMSKISANTDKLKERLEKFKESRRNSETSVNPKTINWKEKRKQFLLKKHEKKVEEEKYRKSTKIYIDEVNDLEQMENEKSQKSSSKACIIF